MTDKFKLTVTIELDEDYADYNPDETQEGIMAIVRNTVCEGLNFVGITADESQVTVALRNGDLEPA